MGKPTLDRLTSTITPITTYGFGYDANSNRTTKTVGAGTKTYTYPGTNNKLASIAGGGTWTYTHDANGSVTSDNTNTFSYDTRGRMTGATTGLGSLTYTLNALGQRYAKTLSGATTVYLYDVAGRLIAETSDGGATYTEYLWLEDTPVAAIKPGSASLYYIHTDHLDTPRLIANQTPVTVWRWDNDDPFGANMVDANPSGLGIFAFNLRLPGQYFDQETNHHYNYFRNYSPEIGRYVEADPLGVVTTLRPTITTGLNQLYAYVANNPLSFVDPLGLELSPSLKGELGSSLLEFLTGNAVEASAKNLGQAIGAGLQGKTGQQGCRDACTEKCLQIINQAAVYFRNEVLFGCIEGCIPKCNECP